MNYIEEQLKLKTEANNEGKIYYTQWEQAKEYIPKVLNTISHYFPHYSLHDKTHSETILNNIVRIIGEKTVEKLSIVDLWFLLTSAYYHDFGMSVDADDKLLFIEDGSKFVDYIADKLKDNSSPMNVYADYFEIKDKKLYYKNSELTKDGLDAQRFLIADFVRSVHADRSEDKIINDRSLNLPGEPIPGRIIRLLGKICKSHTQTYEELMKLPYCESSGCGTENCHPLYVACLLRLGDLLDVDSNRVSEVLLSTLPSIPSDSQLYNQTNRDITHIRIDQSVVEMTAECDNPDVADIINSWFKMIDDELVFQTKNWYKIVPSVDYGTIPTTGEMKVFLKGYDEYNAKNAPRFKVDNARAIEMLQGAGLYNSPTQCIRELLQNSEDATYLRVFKENPRSLWENNNNDAIKRFRDKCKQHPIKVEIKEDTLEYGKKQWKFILKDEGYGMSKEDIGFLIDTGSSSKNIEKQKIIDEMPEWMKPSGCFGIGFQSVFLITDKVTLKTRRYGKENTIKLDLYNPVGKYNGKILWDTYNDENEDIGTTIEFELKNESFYDDAFKYHYYFNYDSRFPNEVLKREVRRYDFTHSDENSKFIVEIMNEISNFSECSNVPIDMTTQSDKKKFGYEGGLVFDYYDEKNGLQLKFGNSIREYSNESSLFFRNQRTDAFGIILSSVLYLNFKVNIVKGKAKDYLTLSRNNINSTRRDSLIKDIVASTSDYVKKNYNTFSDTIKPYASAFLKYNKNGADVVQEDWKWIEIKGFYNVNGKKCDSIKITDILNCNVIEFCGNSGDYTISFIINETRYMIYDAYLSSSDEQFLLYMLNLNHKIQYVSHEKFIFTKENDGFYIPENLYKDWLEMYFKHVSSSREIMPCNDKYKDISVNDGHIIDSTFNRLGRYVDYPVMVCPFVKKYDENDENPTLEYLVDEKMINYVFEHRVHPEVTKDDIKKTYEIFREDFKEAFEKVKADLESKR